MSEDDVQTLRKMQPVLRVAPRPRDLNNNGHIFGGWVLSQMDTAGGIMAARVAQGSTATVAIEAMEFIAPILQRDLISVYARVERIGRTSIAIRAGCDCFAKSRGRMGAGDQRAVYICRAGREPPAAAHHRRIKSQISQHYRRRFSLNESVRSPLAGTVTDHKSLPSLRPRLFAGSRNSF